MFDALENVGPPRLGLTLFKASNKVSQGTVPFQHSTVHHVFFCFHCFSVFSVIFCFCFFFIAFPHHRHGTLWTNTRAAESVVEYLSAGLERNLPAHAGQ